MPDYLAAADWKNKLKGNGEVKDANTLTRALESVARWKGDPARQVSYLKEVVDCAKGLKSKNSKDNGVVKYLDEVVEAARRAQKEAEAAAREEQEKAEAEEGSADADLIKQLVAVRTSGPEKPRFFVVALGKPSGLAIAKVPITRAHKERAKQYRQGKGKLLMGRCFGEGGKYVFELDDKPPGGLAKSLKRAVKLQAEKDIKLMVRGGGVDLDDELDAGELSDFGEEAEEAPEAGAPDTADADADAAFLARAKGLFDGLKAAVAAGTPSGQEAKLRMSEAQVFARSKDYDGADELLDQVEALLKPAAEPTPAQPKPTPSDWQARFDALRPDLMRVLKERLGDTDRVRALVTYTQEKAKAGDRAAADKSLEGLGKAVAAALAAAAAAPAPEADGIYPGLVEYRKALLEFGAARKRVDAQLEALFGTMLAERPEEKNLVRVLRSRVSAECDAIGDAVDAALNAARDERNAYDSSTRALIKQYQQRLAADPLVAHLDANGAVPVAVRATLTAALARIEKTMKA